jgi:hypothetical protein
MEIRWENLVDDDADCVKDDPVSQTDACERADTLADDP